MCGRFSNAQPPLAYTAAVRERFRRQDGHRSKETEPSTQSSGGSSTAEEEPRIQSSLTEDDYYPTHNVSPSSRVPVVRLDKPVPLPSDGKMSGEVGERGMTVECMRWGLLPAYTTSIPRGGDVLRTINARDDSVLSGQSMWTPLLRGGKRCIVFCQGFYEWQKRADGTRIAHFVGMLGTGKGRTDVDGKQRALMPMAGLYESCTIDGEQVRSFTVITTESNKQLNFLHDRMPVILPNSDAMSIWLGLQPASARQVCSLLKPYDEGALDVYPVPREVGKVGNNDPGFILPVSARKDGIAAAFGRVKKPEADANSETHAPVQDNDRKRTLDDDEQLALALQREEDARAKRPKTDAVSDVKVEETGGAEIKSERSADEKQPAPSSKFSPEPFNPPISPPRPQGGYSTAHSSSRASPRKTSGTSKKLEEAAKGTKDIRRFFGSG